MRPGEQGFAQLYLQRPLTLGRGDRFVLRESGRNETVGGGVVLDVDPARLDALLASAEEIGTLVESLKPRLRLLVAVPDLSGLIAGFPLQHGDGDVPDLFGAEPPLEPECACTATNSRPQRVKILS